QLEKGYGRPEPIYFCIAAFSVGVNSPPGLYPSSRNCATHLSWLSFASETPSSPRPIARHCWTSPVRGFTIIVVGEAHPANNTAHAVKPTHLANWSSLAYPTIEVICV